MKICITSQGSDLDAQIDPRFGRCHCFIIVDPETMKFEVIENSNVGAMSGAGIQSAQLIAGKGAEVVLTGNVGPNAFQTLQAAGLKVITGITGSIRDAIERYKKGEITPIAGPSVPGHFGTQMGPGGGIETDKKSMQSGQQPTQIQPLKKEQELEMLKQQAQSMKQGLDQITKKIDELSKKIK